MSGEHKAVVFLDHCIMKPVNRVQKHYVRVQPGGAMVEVDRAFFNEVYRRMSEGSDDSVRVELVLR